MATHSFVLAWRIPWAEMPDAWQATVYGVTKSQTQLSDTHTHTPSAQPKYQPSVSIVLHLPWPWFIMCQIVAMGASFTTCLLAGAPAVIAALHGF